MLRMCRHFYHFILTKYCRFISKTTNCALSFNWDQVPPIDQEFWNWSSFVYYTLHHDSSAVHGNHMDQLCSQTQSQTRLSRQCKQGCLLHHSGINFKPETQDFIGGWEFTPSGRMQHKHWSKSRDEFRAIKPGSYTFCTLEIDHVDGY